MIVYIGEDDEDTMIDSKAPAIDGLMMREW